jgi:hypothetical protein
MTEAQVVGLLGSPRWRGRCGSSDYYVFIRPIEGGRDCLVYSATFAPLNPWYPVVYLDRSDRVIRTFAFGSP